MTAPMIASANLVRYQLLSVISFGLAGIDLEPPVPQAKEAGAVPFGFGDGKGDLRSTTERRYRASSDAASASGASISSAPVTI